MRWRKEAQTPPREAQKTATARPPQAVPEAAKKGRPGRYTGQWAGRGWRTAAE